MLYRCILCIEEVFPRKHPRDDFPARLVMDNLNTHSVGSLYEAFEPAEAKRLADKLEIHYTPKHGSWLNMAEIEIGVLSHQALSDYVTTKEEMMARVAAWQTDRNTGRSTVDWQFTTHDARVKLKRLYPVVTEY